MDYLDIEESIFSIWKKIRLYRFLIILCFCLTVLSLLSGIVIGIMLFMGAFDLSSQIQNLSSVNEVSPEKWLELQNLAQREQQLVLGAVFTCLGTFIIGFLAPSLLIAKLIGSLRKLERQLRETIRQGIHDMTHTLEKYGNEPFANAAYWVEVVIILVQYWARQSRQTSLLLVADLLGVTRQEMVLARQKKPTEPTPEDNKD